MAILHATSDNFNQMVEKKGLVLVDFWAPWCSPCRMLSPILDQLDKELSGKITILKVNVDENPFIASQYGIRSIPTMRLIKNKKDLRAIVGVQPLESLKEMVRPFL
jgi:thioredoxin 1